MKSLHQAEIKTICRLKHIFMQTLMKYFKTKSVFNKNPDVNTGRAINILKKYFRAWTYKDKQATIHYHTMAKGHNWHSSLESLPTITFSYRAWVWMSRQKTLHRHRQRMIIVCLSSSTIHRLSMQVIFIELLTSHATAHYVNGIVGRDTRKLY